MGTPGGFARPSAPHPPPPPLASPFVDFGTCTFPTTPAGYARALALGLAKPALWLRRAKPDYANADALIRREEPVSVPCRLSSEVLSKLPELCPILCPMLCPKPRGWLGKTQEPLPASAGNPQPRSVDVEIVLPWALADSREPSPRGRACPPMTARAACCSAEGADGHEHWQRGQTVAAPTRIRSIAAAQDIWDFSRCNCNRSEIANESGGSTGALKGNWQTVQLRLRLAFMRASRALGGSSTGRSVDRRHTLPHTSPSHNPYAGCSSVAVLVGTTSPSHGGT